jgi:transcriptional regulator of arginine metabolism
VLLISTPPGFASAVAIRIDLAGRYEIAGTIAGDDTILLIRVTISATRQLKSASAQFSIQYK